MKLFKLIVKALGKNNYFKDIMYLEDDNVYTISKMLYENNYLQQLINMFANK